MDTLTDQVQKGIIITVDKNKHAVALGRLGGKKGGKARSESLTAEQRSSIARNAAISRWKKHAERQRERQG